MDNYNQSQFVQQLTVSQKIKLTHGNGAWHTNAVNDLPSVMMTDGPHGLRKQSDENNGINDSKRATCFPTACCVASSWNTDNTAAIASAIAEEALAENVSLVLGPGVNIKRSPLCGRNFEYFSEDPLLAGQMATSYVKAMQAKGVGCTLKHFAVNNQETRRMTVNAVLDERALREIYLAPFERVVRNAHPYAIMASYNKINGESATQNKRLLTDILRKDWGFDGLVMSDWGASYDMGKAYSAGMDLEMPDGGKLHEQRVADALADGSLNVADLDRACLNVANLVQKCISNKPDDIAPADYAAHHALCRQVAADSVVLLKNNGLLPLSKNKQVLVVGELAEKPRFQGAGSSHVNAECKSFLQVLDEYNVPYTYSRGYSVTGDTVNAEWEDEAANLALKFDEVLFFGGLTEDFESEGYDRTSLSLPECQQSLIYKLAQYNPNVIFVAFGGAPFDMPWIGCVKALLQTYLGGEGVTEALYDIIFGDVSPSGRLAETYPLRLSDTPCYNYFANGYNTDERRESIFVGYRFYNTFNVPVLFPFGYGLSYSHFKYTDFIVKQTQAGTVAKVCVKNIGNCNASEVVQIYVDPCECGYMRPKRQLAAFKKIFLQAGEGAEVSLLLDDSAFQIYVNGKFTRVKGKYKVSVCFSVEQTILSRSIEIDGDKLSGDDEARYPCYYTKPSLPWTIDDKQFYSLVGYRPQERPLPKRGEFTLLNTLGDMSQNVGLVRLILKFARKTAIKRSPTHSADDPVARMVYSGALETPLISLVSVGGLQAKYVMYILHHANKRPFRALCALFGNIREYPDKK